MEGVCKKVNATIDTGAMVTTIDESVVKDFKMSPKGYSTLCGVGGGCSKEPYYDMFIFYDGKVFPTLEISRGKVDLDDGCKILIGMDFLSMSDTIIDCDSKQCKVKILYPSTSFHID